MFEDTQRIAKKPTRRQLAAQERRYRWSHPAEWLDHWITTHADDLPALDHIARELATKLDGDQIQDLFQDEMSADGYSRKDRRANQPGTLRVRAPPAHQPPRSGAPLPPLRVRSTHRPHRQTDHAIPAQAAGVVHSKNRG